MALIQYLTQIQFEFGAIRLLADECARIGITRPLVVTDAGVRAAGICKKRWMHSATCRWRCSTRRSRTRPRPRCAPRSRSIARRR